MDRWCLRTTTHYYLLINYLLSRLLHHARYFFLTSVNNCYRILLYQSEKYFYILTKLRGKTRVPPDNLRILSAQNKFVTLPTLKTV